VRSRRALSSSARAGHAGRRPARQGTGRSELDDLGHASSRSRSACSFPPPPLPWSCPGRGERDVRTVRAAHPAQGAAHTRSPQPAACSPRPGNVGGSALVERYEHNTSALRPQTGLNKRLEDDSYLPAPPRNLAFETPGPQSPPNAHTAHPWGRGQSHVSLFPHSVTGRAAPSGESPSAAAGRRGCSAFSRPARRLERLLPAAPSAPASPRTRPSFPRPAS
jgi:hypothetical protein